MEIAFLFWLILQKPPDPPPPREPFVLILQIKADKKKIFYKEK